MNWYKFCPHCATELEWLPRMEDGGATERLCCTGCGFTHWNNPTPVLAAVVELDGRILLARNAAWTHKAYALITGFMEMNETPQDGIRREIKEETALDTHDLNLIGVYEFKRMNQVIIAYHAQCSGQVQLSPELVDYKLLVPEDVKCWSAGTGYALADWLTSRGHTPQFMN